MAGWLPRSTSDSLAATFFHLVTGCAPFPGVKLADLQDQVRRGLPDPDPRCTRSSRAPSILMSTGIGYFFGLPAASNWLAFLKGIPLLSLLHTIIGTGLIASGTAALNQWYERDADRHMRRTSGRPLPSGRLDSNRALAFGAALSVAGFAELWLGVNLLAAAIGAFTLASYLFLYTPMKQRTWWSTTVGAFPGAMPPMIGYAAAAGAINREAWVLFAILFLWQFPHFYSIAWMYKEDYARAGILMLPVVEPDCRSTARQIVLYGITLIPVSLIPACWECPDVSIWWARCCSGCGFSIRACGWRRNGACRAHAGCW